MISTWVLIVKKSCTIMHAGVLCDTRVMKIVHVPYKIQSETEA